MPSTRAGGWVHNAMRGALMVGSEPRTLSRWRVGWLA